VLLARRIADAADSLTKAERRVAELVLAAPEAVAFGTVADVARGSGSGAATVVRLAAKLGFDGFSAMQAEARREMTAQLRPAAERIREPAPDDLLAAARRVEPDNVGRSLDAVEVDAVRAVADAVRRATRVLVISGSATYGVAHQFAAELGMLRDGVHAVNGNPIDVSRHLAFVTADDLVVAVDLRRYERWVVDAVKSAADRGAAVVSLTDGRLSPLARLSRWTFPVAATGAGPFDSQVGTLSVLNVLTAAVADRLRDEASARLDAIETWWRASELLVDD
jgi:DNA-binding MurR/RpiR family transcriptional regulator